MKKASLILVMLSAMCISAFSQVKTQYADSNEHGTTIVVREDGATDADILKLLNSYEDDNFGMGGVIKITSAQPAPAVKEPEVVLVLAEESTTKEVAGQEDFPKEVKPRRVAKKRPLSVRKPTPVRAFVPPAPANITKANSASPSEFRSEALFNKRKGKLRKSKRSKRLVKSKGASCYSF